MDWKNVIFLGMLSGVVLFVAPAFSSGAIPTKVLVRVVSKDAKVIGSGVGGAAVRIVNARTGETLAQGKQEGGTGDTDRIMVKPRARGNVVYGTPGAAFFLAEIGLERPTQVEIRVEAPLGFPQALQRGSKTITLIPGKDIVGEGVVIELDGLIVDIVAPAADGATRRGDELQVRADVRML
jgi:hypothetical protein